ncbi:primosomal replication protein PriC [Glaesserella sp.]|uniref:primosomal replication protein PriC n=1 Tax=Glaesserella sp. TaxID=2094731 RepID=UPI00359FEBEF
MTSFTATIRQHLDQFTPFSEETLEISPPLFSLSRASVAFFCAEILQTCQLLEKQTESDYADIYAQKLVTQFDALNRAVEKLAAHHRRHAVFRSTYTFPKHIHRLPSTKRLAEYHKALRALNEKISWLTEQSYRCTNAQEKAVYLGQIEETEYRKQKCLAAIEALDSYQ